MGRRWFGLGTVLAAMTLSCMAGAQELVKVRFGNLTVASQAAFTAGIETGIFKRHGFDIQVVPLTTGAQANQALASNQVDWSGGGIESTVVAWATDLPFKAYAMYAKGGDSYGILVRTASNIHSAADLKGKTLAVPQGTAPAQGLSQVVQKAGLPANAVRRVNSAYGAMGPLLIQGSVDGMVGLEPFLSLTAEKMGDKASLLMRLGDYVQGGGFFLITDAWAKAHPDKVTEAVLALWEAEQWLRRHPAEAARLQATFLKVDPRLLELSFKWLRYDPLVDEFTLKSLASTADYLAQEGLIPHSIDPARHLAPLMNVTETLKRTAPGLLE